MLIFTPLLLNSIMLQFLKEGVVQFSLWLSISIQVGRDAFEWPPLQGSKLYLLEIYFTYQHYSGLCSQTGFLFWVISMTGKWTFMIHSILFLSSPAYLLKYSLLRIVKQFKNLFLGHILQNILLFILFPWEEEKS